MFIAYIGIVALVVVIAIGITLLGKWICGIIDRPFIADKFFGDLEEGYYSN